MSTKPKTAVVVGATNGIGKAISHRLAGAGFKIVAVGRDRPGRSEEVINELNKASGDHAGEIQHEFRPCNAFLLSQVKECAEGIVRDYGSEGKNGIDALVMTQGMATIQSFTPTSEGNDEKLTLHYWSRAAFASCLLPSLRLSLDSSSMKGGPVVLSILSGGVHSPYKNYAEDPELRNSYSIKNAADSAGYFNDLFFDRMAKQHSNLGINFVHASPGFVASNWGTEMPFFLKGPIRLMQKMGKSTDKCAGFMVDPILASASGDKLKMERPNGATEGLFIMKEDATGGKLTKAHTSDAMNSVWNSTKDVLKRAGIDLEK
mmetsp:Transcript_5764/g.12324  ORF Transcript_5764/g.12324 Transcript_5764/m.12324 type:complete len:318 (-) Transcript_5764:2051-3004(-)